MDFPDLLSRFARAVAANDGPTFSALFTEDGVYDDGFFAAASKMRHYAWVSGETVIEVSGIGPFDITYVDPKDDPSKMAKAN